MGGAYYSDTYVVNGVIAKYESDGTLMWAIYDDAPYTSTPADSMHVITQLDYLEEDSLSYLFGFSDGVPFYTCTNYIVKI
jgi:hypothetical protein